MLYELVFVFFLTPLSYDRPETLIVPFEEYQFHSKIGCRVSAKPALYDMERAGKFSEVPDFIFDLQIHCIPLDATETEHLPNEPLDSPTPGE